MEQPVQNSLSSVLLRSTLLCHGWATGFQGHLPRSLSRAICAECPVQFLCKTAFANSRQAGYNNFVQRVALMRKTGCMRAARCFLSSKWKGKVNPMESSNQFLGTERIDKLMQKYAIPYSPDLDPKRPVFMRFFWLSSLSKPIGKPTKSRNFWCSLTQPECSIHNAA